jgi:DNA polymerase-4/DNA polymerase V
MLNSSTTYPRAIIHIDGDCFFAACEVLQRPELRGKSVVTGSERGIVSSLTYEAKACGVKRGMPLHEVRRVCPEVVLLPSDYELYSLISERMFAIVRRFTSVVEEYSIDECFADLTGLEITHGLSYELIAKKIKETLDHEIGITFSVGLAPTKVLAKIGSKWQKPSGLTFIPTHKIVDFLTQTKVGQVWGIGPQTTLKLENLGIFNADALASKSKSWLEAHFYKPQLEIWQELQGVAVNPVTCVRQVYQSISKTKTFTPASTDEGFVFSQLSKNIENACIKLRRHGLVSGRIHFFLKTQQFEYFGLEIKLGQDTVLPSEIVSIVEKHFREIYNPYLEYRATGVTLLDLREVGSVQFDLFGRAERTEKLKALFVSVDKLAEKYGKHVTFLGSSLRAMVGGAHVGSRAEAPARHLNLFVGESSRKRLGLPFMGEVV